MWPARNAWQPYFNIHAAVNCTNSETDIVANYYFDHVAKGEHAVETSYCLDRNGDYASGTCTVQ